MKSLKSVFWYLYLILICCQAPIYSRIENEIKELEKNLISEEEVEAKFNQITKKLTTLTKHFDDVYCEKKKIIDTGRYTVNATFLQWYNAESNKIGIDFERISLEDVFELSNQGLQLITGVTRNYNFPQRTTSNFLIDKFDVLSTFSSLSQSKLNYYQIKKNIDKNTESISENSASTSIGRLAHPEGLGEDLDEYKPNLKKIREFEKILTQGTFKLGLTKAFEDFIEILREYIQRRYQLYLKKMELDLEKKRSQCNRPDTFTYN